MPKQTLELFPGVWRDPVEILKHALMYLEAIRGKEHAKASQAWELLDSRREELVNRCIQDLLGESAKKNKVQCDCPRHPPRPPEPEPPPPPAKRRPINGKAAASGEREEV